MNSEILLLNSLKKITNFNFGTPSYVYPEDIIPNVIVLGDIVDEIELIFFESKEYSNIPDQNTKRKLLDLKKMYDIQYNIHLPIDIKLIHPEKKERKRAIDTLKRVYEKSLFLNPNTYTFHMDDYDYDLYQKYGFEIISDLKRTFNKDIPICVENINQDFHRFAIDMIKDGFYVCLDIGHILKSKEKIALYLEKYGEYIKIFHLHGIKEHKDHHSIKCISEDELDLILRCAEKNNASVILEQFYFKEVSESIDILRRKYGKSIDNRWN